MKFKIGDEVGDFWTIHNIGNEKKFTTYKVESILTEKTVLIYDETNLYHKYSVYNVEDLKKFDFYTEGLKNSLKQIELEFIEENSLDLKSLDHNVEFSDKGLKVGCQSISIEDAKEIAFEILDRY